MDNGVLIMEAPSTKLDIKLSDSKVIATLLAATVRNPTSIAYELMLIPQFFDDREERIKTPYKYVFFDPSWTRITVSNNY